MKYFLTRLLACVALFATGVSAQKVPEKDYRDFKAPNGKVIKAVMLDKTDTEVVLLLHNGTRTNVPMDKLSEEDREYAKDWAKDKAAFVMKCRGLTIRQCLELRGYESFPFRLENNALFIDGKINGKPARLLIDTGAGTSLLHEPYAKSVGLEVGEMTETVLGIAGEAAAGWTPVPTLQLGEAVFKDRRILATNLVKGQPEGTKSSEDAILGADFMSKLDAVISYPDQRIFLRPDKSDEDEAGLAKEGASTDFRLFKTKEGRAIRGNVVSKTPTVATFKLINGTTQEMAVDHFISEDQEYLNAWSEEGSFFLKYCQSLTINELLTLRKYQSFEFERRGNHIFVEGTLNDNKVTYMIDTGAANTCLHVESANKFGCTVGKMDQWVYGIGGKAPAAVSVIHKLTLGKTILTDRKVLATDLKRGEPDGDLRYVGIFGADFMRELDAVVTYTENRIFLIQR